MTSRTVSIGNHDEEGCLIEFKDSGDIIVKNEIIKTDKKLTDAVHEAFESIFNLRAANELIDEIERFAKLETAYESHRLERIRTLINEYRDNK